MSAALFDLTPTTADAGVLWRLGEPWEATDLLTRRHYLGPLTARVPLTIVGDRGGEIVAAMLWKLPTARRLPPNGSWLELARWCLTPDAGPNAGSRMHKRAVKLVRDLRPTTTTLVSYSDPAHGHTGALYRACNWRWCPTWQRLRPPPSGGGDWGTGRQEPKDRWVFPVRRDSTRADVLRIKDAGAVRYWRARATPDELANAVRSADLVPELTE